MTQQQPQKGYEHFPIVGDHGLSDAERRDQRLRDRASELRSGHWNVRVCARGHQIESHRAGAGGADDTVRCPMCGAPAARETPEQTARREFDRDNSPRAILARVADALSEWGAHHLNASHWTQRSEAERAARRKQDDERSGQGAFRQHDL